MRKKSSSVATFQFIIHNQNHIRRFQKRVPAVAQSIPNSFVAINFLINNVNQTGKFDEILSAQTRFANFYHFSN